MIPSFFLGPTSVINYWQNTLDKYKAARALEEHTGGGDGDEDSNDADAESSVPTQDSKVNGKRVTKYTPEFLALFRETNIYKMIDRVARDDESIVHKRSFSSVAPISDEESDTVVEPTTPGPSSKRSRKENIPPADNLPSSEMMMKEALKDMKDRSQLRTQIETDRNQIEKDKLTLAQRQDERNELESKLRRRNLMLEQVEKMLTSDRVSTRERAEKIQDSILADMERELGL
ncbi:hypothetical protein NLI96_g12686 [Meripilus lineatus]|uniref:Uncharacterized protein n=1 Tax=Meripilus lineatus TaxID=2056292 RepID=A0AAD5UU43_9APHY|nr:hypothetical protein NLI96_g12686 [Physisporinus lineatus]